MLQLSDFSAGASGFVGETDKGGAVDNQGHLTPNGNAIPDVSAPAQYTIPLRTPFALTGRDRRGRRPADVLVGAERPRRSTRDIAAEQHEDDGPLFAMFPVGTDQRRPTRCSTTRPARTI